MVIGVRNLDKCIRKFDKLGKTDLSQAFLDSAIMVQKHAKKLAPVNKDPMASTRGNLRNSIRRSKLNGSYKNGASVGTNVEYAIYQEFGTYKMNAQPFLRPALTKNSKAIKQRIIDEINKQNSKAIK